MNVTDESPECGTEQRSMYCSGWLRLEQGTGAGWDHGFICQELSGCLVQTDMWEFMEMPVMGSGRVYPDNGNVVVRCRV